MKILALSAAIMVLSATAAEPPRPLTLATLGEGRQANGFRAAALYLNDSERPMGARFIHLKSGFTLDVLEIQSVPQGFIWVTSYPTSNMGEPHTQEHLLLGKGNKGRAVASHEPMALATSTAFTMQWRTCYSFYSPAGAGVFFDQVERRLDAMLHPDYTDEEIRREVRNFGVAENQRDKSLRLEEKGTVYNEMVSTMDQPNARLWRTSGVTIYGPEHPLSYNAGGSPEALRVMQPADIRKFHRDNYHLANMGMLASLPKDVPLATVLERFDALLGRLEPSRPNRPVKTRKDLPAPQPAPAGEIRIVEYPHRNEQQPGTAMFLWPAERTLTRVEQELLDLFLDAFAGDPTTNLYKRFIDSRTREADIGARSVSAQASDELGHPVTVAFGDLAAAKMNERDLGELRAKVLDELNRISAWKEGSPELEEFNRRVRSRLTQTRRTLSKFVSSPPRFGFRMANAGWMQHLDQLNQVPGFTKAVTLKPELAEVERLLGQKGNLWSGLLAKWKLTGREPWVLGSRANPALIEREQAEREKRAATELARLKEKYGAADDQETIRRYRAEYDAATLALERAEAAVAPAKFVDTPPLTLDDQLDYKVTKLVGGIPMVASTFDGMTSATTGIALRLDGVPVAKFPALVLLPALLSRVGVIEDGKPVSFEQMSERLKYEILSLNANFNSNASTGRVELVVRGSGNDQAEARKALDWMRLVLFHPDWRPENLARIRDVVDQSLSGLRRGMQRPEELWVNGPVNAWWRQDRPLTLLAESFLTQAHEALRLRWMLKEGAPEARAAAAAFLAELAGEAGTRAERKALLAQVQAGKSSRVPEAARALAIEAAKDLDAALPDLPDSSLAADWRYLCNRMRGDLLLGPEKALAALDEVRRLILKTGGARMFLISSAATRRELEPGIEELAGRLEKAPAARPLPAAGRLVGSRLRGRDASATNPIYVGLLNPNSQGGVFLHSAPLAGYRETDREKLLDYLATNIYGGRGAHGMFMKTWAAGLAYSNGIRVRPSTGRLNYYAERTPELPQTLKFVVGELKKAPKPEPALVEYAIAEAFAPTRAASPYETRGEEMADDLADGLTPEVVGRFRKGLLELRKTPDLPGELYKRMNRSYGTVLPGLAGKTATVKDGVYFVIGPEKQLAAWEDYLKTVEGPETKLHRLYPRDYWIVAE